MSSNDTHINLLPPAAEQNESTASLLQKNIALSETLIEQNKAIQRRLTMMVVGSYLRLLVFVVPILLAALFLPAIMRNIVDPYLQLFGSTSGAASSTPGLTEEQQTAIRAFFQK